MLTSILIFLTSLVSQANSTPTCQGAEILIADNCAGDELSAEENLLYQKINQYRQENRLPPLTLSPNLNRVANRHLLDWQYNAERFSRQGQYWRFGWSDCPYDAQNSRTFPCMWQAPQRWQANSSKGYEIICRGVGQINAEQALQCWQQSPEHDDIILTKGNWQDYSWQAIGVGLESGQAVVWLSSLTEPSNPPNTSPRPRGGRIW